MELERETLVEILVSVGAVVLFVAVILWIGVTYGNDGHVDEQGGLALLGAIVLFILVMTAIGYWLSGLES